MKNLEQKTALENHLNVLGDSKLKICEKQVCDARKTIPKFFIQNGTHTISPALKYEDLNLFILGMSRAKQIKNQEAVEEQKQKLIESIEERSHNIYDTSPLDGFLNRIYTKLEKKNF